MKTVDTPPARVAAPSPAEIEAAWEAFRRHVIAWWDGFQKAVRPYAPLIKAEIVRREQERRERLSRMHRMYGARRRKRK